MLDSLKKNQVYRTIRQEWNNQRNEGKRQKKALEAAEKKWSTSYLNKYVSTINYTHNISSFDQLLLLKTPEQRQQSRTTEAIFRNQARVIESLQQLPFYIMAELIC